MTSIPGASGPHAAVSRFSSTHGIARSLGLSISKVGAVVAPASPAGLLEGLGGMTREIGALPFLTLQVPL